jgi:hypothetical protein
MSEWIEDNVVEVIVGLLFVCLIIVFIQRVGAKHDEVRDECRDRGGNIKTVDGGRSTIFICTDPNGVLLFTRKTI